MPIFGDKPRFAIEYSLNQDYGGEWLFGRFCYWCGGDQVGDYDLGTSLRDVLFQLERIQCDAGRRANPRFTGSSPDQVFTLLNAGLFGRDTFNEAEVANEEQWARHLIVPAVDVFDEWKGFLVEEGSVARLIIAHARSGRSQELLLKTGEFDQVLERAVRDLHSLYERTTKSSDG